GTEVATGLGRGQALRDEERRPPPEILRAGDVPLSVGAHPYGACAQLHDGRRGGAPSPRARLQRAASDGMGRLRPAGGERGARPGREPAQLDLREHRIDEGPAEGYGPVARLGARDRDLRPFLLPPSAEDV